MKVQTVSKQMPFQNPKIFRIGGGGNTITHVLAHHMALNDRMGFSSSRNHDLIKIALIKVIAHAFKFVIGV
jgi:hypothetical protein